MCKLSEAVISLKTNYLKNIYSDDQRQRTIHRRISITITQLWDALPGKTMNLFGGVMRYNDGRQRKHAVAGARGGEPAVYLKRTFCVSRKRQRHVVIFLYSIYR